MKNIADIAIDILHGNEEDYTNCKTNKFFDRTNEYLDYFFERLPIKNSDVLTVTGSGDQILTAALYGARRIDAFDYNPLANKFGKLKVAGMQSLTREEFNKYFDYYPIYLYKKVREYLNGEDKLFWDRLYTEGQFDILYENIIVPPTFWKEKKHAFQSEGNYEITKDRIKDISINFYNIEFFKLYKKLKEYYDVIYLSNVHDSLGIKKKKFIYYTDKKLDKLLKENGVISLYSSVDGSRCEKLEEIANNRDDINVQFIDDEELITRKKTRKI